MVRKTFIAGNWKMNKTSSDIKTYFSGLKIEKKERTIALCVPFTLLSTVKDYVKQKGVLLAAQNMHYEESGAFTGEISPAMLLDAGCDYVVLGHSERRHIFGEDDELINKKVISALAHKLKVILCVGEKLEERETGKTSKVVSSQLKKCLKGVKQISEVVIAYEPVWAIGTGKTATPKQAEEVHAYIRKLLTQMYDKKTADKQLIIYGGSVKPENVKELMSMENIDGALPGSASLDPKKFSAICNF